MNVFKQMPFFLYKYWKKKNTKRRKQSRNFDKTDSPSMTPPRYMNRSSLKNAI